MSGDERLLSYLIERVEKIDSKVDKLLQFKWQIVGGSIAVSAIISGLVALIKH